MVSLYIHSSQETIEQKYKVTWIQMTELDLPHEPCVSKHKHNQLGQPSLEVGAPRTSNSHQIQHFPRAKAGYRSEYAQPAARLLLASANKASDR